MWEEEVPTKETRKEWVATEIEGDEEVASPELRDSEEGQISSSRCQDGAGREVGEPAIRLSTTMMNPLGHLTGLFHWNDGDKSPICVAL